MNNVCIELVSTCVSCLTKPPPQDALLRRFLGCARDCGADICRDAIARTVSRRSLCGPAGPLPANCRRELHYGLCGHRSAGSGSAGECRTGDFHRAPPQTACHSHRFRGNSLARLQGTRPHRHHVAPTLVLGRQQRACRRHRFRGKSRAGLRSTCRRPHRASARRSRLPVPPGAVGERFATIRSGVALAMGL